MGMAVVMLVLFVVGVILARVGMSSRGGDELLAFVGSIAIGVSGLWFLSSLLFLSCGSDPGPID
jgi:hypothetical protein